MESKNLSSLSLSLSIYIYIYITPKKVYDKPCEYDKMYMVKDLIEDKAYELKVQFTETR